MNSLDIIGFIGKIYEGERHCMVFAAKFLAAKGVELAVEINDPSQAHGWVQVERPAPLDVIVFKRAGHPAHVGVYVGKGEFIHSDDSHTSRVERLDSVFWRNRIEGYYRKER